MVHHKSHTKVIKLLSPTIIIILYKTLLTIIVDSKTTINIHDSIDGLLHEQSKALTSLLCSFPKAIQPEYNITNHIPENNTTKTTQYAASHNNDDNSHHFT